MKRQFLWNTIVSVCLTMFLVTPSFASVRIMPLGDSITEGISGSSDDTGYRRSLYLSLTSAGYDVDFVGSQTHGIPTDFDRNHEGHGGWRANQIRDNTMNWLIANPADVILLHIGTNDLWHDLQPAAEVAAEVNQILNIIDTYEATYDTAITVILAQIIDLDHNLATAAQIQVTADYYYEIENLYNSRVAQGDNIEIVDMYNALTYPNDMADVAHPNDSGYNKMAGVWFNAITALNSDYVYNVSLAATSLAHSSDDDLICSYNAGNDITAVATAWYKSGNSIMDLYMPMEGGEPNALNDFSGNNATCTTIGNVTWSATAGHDGSGAFVFDGSNYIQAGMNFPTNSSYTKTSWVYRTSDGGDNNIISGNNNSGSHVFWAPATQGYKLSAGYTNTWFNVQDSAKLELNTWYFVAVTFDAAASEMVLYKNGVEVDRAACPNNITDQAILVGAFKQGHNWFGTIDDARVYNSALSGEQIAAMYNGGIGDNNTIVSEETSDDEIWQAKVIPFLSTGLGTSVDSNTVLIGNGSDVENVEIGSASGQDLSSEDILCSYDLTGTANTAATAWYKTDTPIMSLFMPMEGGALSALGDYSGNGGRGSIIGDPTWSATAGHDGHGAFVFDGTDDQIIAGEKFPIRSSYTKIAWVYRSSDGGDNNIISGDTNSGSHAFWAPASQSYKLSAGNNGAWFNVQDSVTLALNTWFLVAVTFDASSGDMVLYKNGVEIDRAASTNDVTDATIAVGSFNKGHNWFGTIDDARVYTYALSGEQIAAMYNGGTGDNNTIVSEETSDGETWYAKVTAFSDFEPGVTGQSNIVTIGGEVALYVDNLEVSSLTGKDLSSDDIQCQYDISGIVTTAATVWYKSGNSIMNFYMPMEGGIANALKDISGQGGAGLIQGNPVWSATAGHDGHGAFIFDGTDDHITAGEKFPVQSSYTKMAWVYRTSDTGNNNIISGDIAAGGHAFWAPQSVGNKLSAGQNNSWFIVQDSVKLALNTWFLVAVTFDASTGEMVLYKNGVEVDRATTTNIVTDATILVGSHNHGSLWTGTIDDACVYNCSLSGEQIAAMYNGGSGNTNIIISKETSVADTWQARVTPFSDSRAGNAIPSILVTINASVSGYVKNILDTPVAGVSVAADNGGGTDTTGLDGFYQVAIPYEWSGSVSAIKADYTFISPVFTFPVIEDQMDNFMAQLNADIDNSGDVTILDLQILCNNWLTAGTLNNGDMDDNGFINLLDVSIMGSHWLE